MRTLVVLVRIWLARLGFLVGRLLPVRRRVVLATSHADRIDGNLACIRAELARRRLGPVVVFAFRSTGGVTGGLRTALGTVAGGFLLATSSVFVVDDYFFPIYVVRPRSGTRIIQVWHACGAFKKFGHSLGDRGFGAAPELVRRVPIHSNYDVCLASSRSAAIWYAEAFRQPLERFEWRLGIPKTDLLFGERARDAAERVRREYGIPPSKRVVLYAPTFRGETTYDARYPELLDLALLDERLGDDHVVLLRLHPFVRQRPTAHRTRPGFVVDASDEPEIADLMLASDVLLTDYSSVIFDFSLLGRPIVLFAPDHDAYERERGFYFDYRRDGPGPVFGTSDEVAMYIRNGEFDTARVERFRDVWFDVADGHASERVVDELIAPGLSAPPAPKGQASPALPRGRRRR